MGMSASCMRFLALTARKSNVEFEGQQINQQRTTLSNQSANYYSQLANMAVPTPPSVDDYTKVTYTFDDGALTNTVTSMIAKGNNQYSISYIQQWQDDYSIVSASSSLIAKDGDKYKIGTSTLRKLGTVGNYTLDQIKAMTDEQYSTLQTSDSVQSDSYLKTLEKDQLLDLLEQEQYYQSMLNDNTLNNPDAKNQWYVRYVKDTTSGSYVPYFYQASDVENADNYTDGYATSNINCYSIGSSTKTKEILNQIGTVEKDSSGRYISITLYQLDEDGDIDPDKYTTYSLTTNTSTDEEAYNDAMNQYNYAQNKYEQQIQDINSKLEVVQQQDKSLELNLKQLDTEENAISTELDAVKKVISKNVESSFKTFNA